MSCTRCQFTPPCSSREQMTERHGTPAAFARAVRAAIGEISIDEAEVAVRRYYDDWGATGRKGGA
jgi:hypothetical protein